MSTRDGLLPPSVDIGATLDDGPFTTMQRCVVLLAALAIAHALYTHLAHA